MAKGRVFNQLKSLGIQHRLIAFSFLPQGASAPKLGEGTAGVITSVVRNSAGSWTVTMADVWPAVIGVFPSIQMNAATDLNPQIVGAVTASPSTTGTTFTINALTGGTPTDIAANANNSVSVIVVVRDSSVLP